MRSPILIYLLFIYGLVLFAMGLSIILEIRRGSTLPLARSLWWLAGFGLLHSVVEWLEMLQFVDRRGANLVGAGFLSLPILFFLVTSGVLLAQFGASLLAASVPRLRWIRWIPLSLLPIWLLALWLASGGQWLADDFQRLGVVTARYALYVPGTILSGLALLSQRSVFRDMGLPQIARDCTLGAAVFAFKGFVAGLIVPSADFFPASVLNYSTFVDIVGLPAEAFRALAAVGITYFVVRVLRSFEVRRRQELEHVSHQFKRLSSQALNAQEEERKRIARELHDDTAQLLSSLLLRLKMLERAKSLEEVRDRSNHLIELTSQAVEGVRRMAYELRPAALEDLGLPAAIRWYSEELATPRGLSVEIRDGGLRGRLPAQTELGLYRVVQEALINVAKHSGAHDASVTLERINGSVRVLVEDNGRGFDVDEVTRSRERGLGLFGMRERVSLLGGALHIQSQLEQGTKITVEVPILDKVRASEW